MTARKVLVGRIPRGRKYCSSPICTQPAANDAAIDIVSEIPLSYDFDNLSSSGFLEELALRNDSLVV